MRCRLQIYRIHGDDKDTHVFKGHTLLPIVRAQTMRNCGVFTAAGPTFERFLPATANFTRNHLINISSKIFIPVRRDKILLNSVVGVVDGRKQYIHSQSEDIRGRKMKNVLPKLHRIRIIIHFCFVVSSCGERARGS